MPRPAPVAEHDETEADRQRRISREAAMIAAADADIAAGRTVSEAEVDAWIDSLGTDHELPPPYPRR
jgi:predicted transcriptional regulator